MKPSSEREKHKLFLQEIGVQLATMTEHTDIKEEKSKLLNLNSLLSDISTQMTGNTIPLPSRFRFIWQNITFAGQLRPTREKNKYSMKLAANLGYIPFSAENKARHKTFLDRFAPLFLTGEYTLSRNSQIQFQISTEFTGPINARKLMEVITYSLMDRQEDILAAKREL